MGIARAAALSLAVVGGLVLGACSEPAGEPTSISLVERFGEARVDNAVEATAPEQTFEWSFTAEALGEDGHGWRVLRDVDGLEVSDDRLLGRSTGSPLIVVTAPDGLDATDQLYSLEIRQKTSQGSKLAVAFFAGDELDEEEVLGLFGDRPIGDLSKDLTPGDEVETYLMTQADSTISPSFSLARMQYIVVSPTDEEGATFEIESMKLVPLKDHLASVPSGFGWHGLGEIYRETIVARAPEAVVWEIDLPSDPSLELNVGTIEDGAVTFRAEVRAGDDVRQVRRTISTAQRWEPLSLDLSDLGGDRIELTLALEAEEEGRLGYWGGPSVRNRAGASTTIEASAARAALGGETRPPQGVIFIIADTLRRDHLPFYGYDRDNAPFLSTLAAEGAVFEDAIAQGTWTKISVPSILTSLYPSTHGLKDMPDRISASITTAAEAFRGAGFTTLATSSIPFSGKLTNLHQGVDVLHERASLVDSSDLLSAKTAKGFVDRLLPWIEKNRDRPFFAFLHVFDPHSPFEPAAPYNSMWMDPDTMAAHRDDMEKVMEEISHPFFKPQALPTQEEIDRTDVDQAAYVEREKVWYDASIRAMDVEIARLVERLGELGLAEDTLIVFLADHGEEFLEHGRHFHGYNAYGEMINIPLVMWWPGVIPAGKRVATTVQAIDVLPTVLDLARIPVPEEAQGQSLLPLVAGDPPEELGWRRRPAFAERAYAPTAFTDDTDPIEAITVVDGEWKLIKNLALPEGRPEYELYDHREDPINTTNLADQHPDVVERLSKLLESWHESAKAAHIAPDAAAEDMSPEELERLRSLGYV
jgi:arylsulfatase A-like enzyme